MHSNTISFCCALALIHNEFWGDLAVVSCAGPKITEFLGFLRLSGRNLEVAYFGALGLESLESY